jgi:hypothetical protein
MKLKRFLLIYFLVVLAGVFCFSCIDQSYDLEKLSGKIELFGNSISVPIGTTTIYLDSVVGNLTQDSGSLTVKDGVYVFEFAGSMDMSGLTSALGDFSLAAVDSIMTTTPLYDASLVLWTPYDVPPSVYNYTDNSSMTLPDFSTDLIAVDSVDLSNCIVRIILRSEGLGGPKLNSSTLTLPLKSDTLPRPDKNLVLLASGCIKVISSPFRPGITRSLKAISDRRLRAILPSPKPKQDFFGAMAGFMRVCMGDLSRKYREFTF